ncbi:MAG TPA: hypothetical protein ENK88_08820 [Campylobacterales bacterium]|nr:hypothetical protein [Campylobacterales bacterium]HHD80346.1 hypothetical protein [Campylobacterales bacterium]
MDKILSSFQFNTEFFIMIGIFLIISLIITIIIVFFVSEINRLNAILNKAREIDKYKIAKIDKLEQELKESKFKISELTKELKFLPKNRYKLKDAMQTIEKLKEELYLKSQKYINRLHQEEIDFENLSVRYELLNKSYIQLENRYNEIKDKYETLLQENSNLHTNLQESFYKISEQEKYINKIKVFNKKPKPLNRA